MSKVAEALVKSGIQVLKAAGKGTVKGVKEGTREAARNFVRNEGGRFMRGRLGYDSLRAAAPSAHELVAPPALSIAATRQLFPTFCDCEENPIAPRGQAGKLLKCHSCAPRGLPAREYRTQLEGHTFATRKRSPNGLASSIFKLRGITASKKRSGSRSKSSGRAKSSETKKRSGSGSRH
jgi:hypothetical protein